MKLTRTQKFTAVLIVMALILAAVAAVAAFGGWGAGKEPLFAGSGRLAGPELPQLAFEDYPTEEQEAALSDIYDRLDGYREAFPGYALSLAPFYEKSIRNILSQHGGENRVYSPLNLYMALSMAAEITGGTTRGQILDLLGSPDIERLREQSGDIWLFNSVSKFGGAAELNNSIWLSNSINYKTDTLDILANEHFAESFHGEPGTGEYDKLLQDWTNEKTHNLLEESANGLKMDADMLMTIMSTVYFKAAWGSTFPEENSAVQTFHAPGGGEDCTFMRRSSPGSYYWGEHFGAAQAHFSDGGGMVLILPDEDSDLEQVLGGDSDLWEFLRWRMMSRHSDSFPQWGGQAYVIVDLALPKFDVASNSELSEDLKALGVTEAFDPNTSNFGPLMHDNVPACISEVNHAARVMIDEEGCTAASYVEMAARCGAAAPPEEEIDFTLDRPFIFIIESKDDLPLFAGVVNRP